jgi:hypothetical protein
VFDNPPHGRPHIIKYLDILVEERQMLSLKTIAAMAGSLGNVVPRAATDHHVKATKSPYKLLDHITLLQRSLSAVVHNCH